MQIDTDYYWENCSEREKEREGRGKREVER